MTPRCFSSYMSMQCSSIFPRCTTPQSRDESAPIGGRVPMCLHLCVIPLVTCPGFWINDIMGTCTLLSVPPMCTQAFFFNLVSELLSVLNGKGDTVSPPTFSQFKLPPQYTSFDEVRAPYVCVTFPNTPSFEIDDVQQILCTRPTHSQKIAPKPICLAWTRWKTLRFMMKWPFPRALS